MRSPERSNRHDTLAVRALVALFVGVVVAALIKFTGALHASDDWVYLLTGWIASAVLYVGWTWAIVARMDPSRTKSHAVQEDPAHFTTVLSVVIPSIASLAAVVFMLRDPSKSGLDPFAAAGVGAVSVAAAWVAVHTVFTLHYARLYYSDAEADVGFNNKDEEPRYTDFAYLSFTIGMAYAVSDTALQGHEIRRTALWHALVSYLLGAVILAVTINLVAGLKG